MCRRYKFVIKHFGRSERSKKHASGAQALFVFDKRVAFALHIRHVGFKGLDGVGRVAHELHRRFPVTLFRGRRAVRQTGGGVETVRS